MIMQKREDAEQVDPEAYGKSTPDADSVVDLETLKEGYQYIDGGNWEYPLTYEQVYEKMGNVHGRAVIAGWTKEDLHFYRWATSTDEEVYIQVYFKVLDDGEEIYGSMTHSDGVAEE